MSSTYKILSTGENIIADEQFMVEQYGAGTYELVETHEEIKLIRKLSKLQFINLFTDAEYVGILTAAKQSVLVEAWLKKFEMTSVEPDGGSIDPTDERTVAGMLALEAAGILASGRAQQILNQAKGM